MKEALTLITIIFGSMGFWKFIEVVLHLRLNKRVKKAETNHLYSQASSQIVENWIQWSQKLESRVKELEDYNAEMRQTITRQKEHIAQLTKNLTLLEKRNKELTGKLNQLERNGHR